MMVESQSASSLSFQVGVIDGAVPIAKASGNNNGGSEVNHGWFIASEAFKRDVGE